MFNKPKQSPRGMSQPDLSKMLNFKQNNQNMILKSEKSANILRILSSKFLNDVNGEVMFNKE